jgi:hypothetical protein
VSSGPAGTTWAVGHSCASGCGTTSEIDKTLVLRWKHGAWSQIPSPSPGRITSLGSVTAAPGGSAWAVGLSCVTGCGTALQQVRTLILRRQGHRWAAASP